MQPTIGGPALARCPRLQSTIKGHCSAASRQPALLFLSPPTCSTWVPIVVPKTLSRTGQTRGSPDVSTHAATLGRFSGRTAGGFAREPPASDTTGASAGSSAQAAAQGAKRQRLVFPREVPTINWDRWELGIYRRIAEREKAGPAPPGGEGEAAAGAGSASSGSSGSWFADQLAGSDLTAAYFRRYDDPTVHQPLLQDRVLVNAWRDAIAAAPPGALQGKTVLDVGCGMGLLSMLAAKAGAARVIAVDGSEGAAESARRIIRANGLDDRITVVHGALEDLTALPGVRPGEVDVVLSNWMGPGLLAGGMVNAVAHAAKTWLRPGGLVLPDQVSLWAAALEDRDALQEAKDSWSRVAGLDLTAALAEVIKHPRRDVLTRKSQLLSAPQRLAQWGTAALRPEAVVDPETGAYATCPLKLPIVRDERLFGLVLYWEAQWTFGGALEGEDRSPVKFSTHPLGSTTHYQQVMLDFPRSMRVEADDEVVGQVVLRPGRTDPRDLELEVEAAVIAAGGEPAGAGVAATYRVSHLG